MSVSSPSEVARIVTFREDVPDGLSFERIFRPSAPFTLESLEATIRTKAGLTDANICLRLEFEGASDGRVLVLQSDTEVDAMNYRLITSTMNTGNIDAGRINFRLALRPRTTPSSAAPTPVAPQQHRQPENEHRERPNAIASSSSSPPMPRSSSAVVSSPIKKRPSRAVDGADLVAQFVVPSISTFAESSLPPSSPSKPGPVPSSSSVGPKKRTKARASMPTAPKSGQPDATTADVPMVDAAARPDATMPSTSEKGGKGKGKMVVDSDDEWEDQHQPVKKAKKEKRKKARIAALTAPDENIELDTPIPSSLEAPSTPKETVTPVRQPKDADPPARPSPSAGPVASTSTSNPVVVPKSTPSHTSKPTSQRRPRKSGAEVAARAAEKLTHAVGPDGVPGKRGAGRPKAGVLYVTTSEAARVKAVGRKTAMTERWVKRFDADSEEMRISRADLLIEIILPWLYSMGTDAGLRLLGQKTLATLLRVSKNAFGITGPVLYRHIRLSTFSQWFGIFASDPVDFMIPYFGRHLVQTATLLLSPSEVQKCTRISLSLHNNHFAAPKLSHIRIFLPVADQIFKVHLDNLVTTILELILSELNNRPPTFQDERVEAGTAWIQLVMRGTEEHGSEDLARRTQKVLREAWNDAVEDSGEPSWESHMGEFLEAVAWNEGDPVV